MRTNSLGERMKEYERVSDLKFTKRLPMIIRLDGKAFHSWTNKSGCAQPFDHTLMNMMIGLTQHLCANIDGATWGYTQSDEVSILVRDDLATKPWFDKRAQKIVSVAASLATFWFNANNGFTKKFPAFFDARAFVLPEHEVRNYFVWRQEDATTNSLLMLAQSLYPAKELHGKKSAMLQELCWQKGRNWNDLTPAEKRGTCVKRQKVIVAGHCGPIERQRFVADLATPIFSAPEADMLFASLLAPGREGER